MAQYDIAVMEALTNGFVRQLIQRLKCEQRYIHTKIAVFDNIHVAGEHPLARQKSVRFSVCAEYPMLAPAEPWQCACRT